MTTQARKRPHFLDITAVTLVQNFSTRTSICFKGFEHPDKDGNFGNVAAATERNGIIVPGFKSCEIWVPWAVNGQSDIDDGHYIAIATGEVQDLTRQTDADFIIYQLNSNLWYITKGNNKQISSSLPTTPNASIRGDRTVNIYDSGAAGLVLNVN